MGEGTDKPVAKVLICEPMRALRDKMVREAGLAGAEVVPVSTGKEALQAAAHQKPNLALLSSAVSDVHIENLLKAFQVSEHTRNIPLVVATDEVLQARLKMFLKQGAAECVQRAIPAERFTRLLDKHANLRLVDPAAARRDRATRIFKRAQLPKSEAPSEEGKTSPLLVKQIRCPLHRESDSFDTFYVRSRSQIVEYNMFDVAVYKGAMKNFFAVPFLLYEPSVCPHCLYASTDVNFFLREGDGRAARDIWPDRVREELRDRREERIALVDCEPVELFGNSRSVAGGLAGLKLCVATSRALFDFDNKTYCNELYRVANYYLRMAQILAEDGRGDESDEYLTEGFHVLEKAFPHTSGPAFFRLMYQLLAIGVYFSWDEKVGVYFSRLREMEASIVTDSKEDEASRRYAKRIRRLWEDRAYRRKGMEPVAGENNSSRAASSGDNAVTEGAETHDADRPDEEE